MEARARRRKLSHGEKAAADEEDQAGRDPMACAGKAVALSLRRVEVAARIVRRAPRAARAVSARANRKPRQNSAPMR